MIRSLYFSKTGRLRVDLNPVEITSILARPQGLLWIDLDNILPQVTASLLTETFRLHPLAIDDFLDGNLVSRMEDWGDYIFASLVAVGGYHTDRAYEDGKVEMTILKMLLGKGFILTQHDRPLDMINMIWESIQRTVNKSRMKPFELLRELIDETVQTYVFAAQLFDEQITEIRFNKAYRNQNEQIMRMRKVANDIRRHFDDLRLLVDTLARKEFDSIDNEYRSQIQAVYERTTEIRNEFLRLENPQSSSQIVESQPPFSRLTNSLRRTVDTSELNRAKRSYHARSIFISYRRDDSADVTGRVYDRLIAHFGNHAVFKDVDSIQLGSNFKKDLGSALKKCKVVLAIIGNQWIEISDAHGRRLDNPDDFVRIEIETALARGVPIIPIFVQNAKMPAKQELPSSLADLIDHQGLRVRPDPDFHNDVDRLISHLDEMIK
jgi:Mg2+ and Co2+ transporter CorA